MTTIGIFGTDPRAIAIGRLLAQAGAHVRVAGVTSRESTEAAARSMGAVADIPYNVGTACEAIVFACPRSDTDAFLAKLGGLPAQATIVDAMTGETPEQGRRNPLRLAHKLDTHRLVRALVILPQPGATIALCGDDPVAKAQVAEAFRACGCRTDDCGPLRACANLEPQQHARSA